MSEVSNSDAAPDEVGGVTVIGHLLIRDADTGEVLLSRRDHSPAPIPSSDEE